MTNEARYDATIDALSVAIRKVPFQRESKLHVSVLLLFANCYERAGEVKKSSVRALSRAHCQRLVDIASDPALARRLADPGAGPIGEWTDMPGYRGEIYTPALLIADALVHAGSVERDKGDLAAAEARYAEASEKFAAELKRAARGDGGSRVRDALVEQAQSGLQRSEWNLSCYHETRAMEGVTTSDNSIPPRGLDSTGFAFPTAAQPLPR